MERDFMGLNSKDPILINVQKDCEESGFDRSSGVSDNSSALPQFMSLRCGQDEKVSTKSDILPSHACMEPSGSKMFEAMHKRQSPDFQPPRMGACQNFGANANMKQHFLGGISSAPPFIPPMARISTAKWNQSKASSASAQLTIFYDGTVNVFDDITPEKAQAIIFLAGNGCALSNMQGSGSEFDMPLINQSMTMAPSSNLPSNNNNNNNNVIMVSKTGGMSTSVVNKTEPPRVGLPLRSVAATSMISLATPQARKASLARFLERRKERALNAAPYSPSKHAVDCATPKSNNFGLSSSDCISKRN